MKTPSVYDFDALHEAIKRRADAPASGGADVLYYYELRTDSYCYKPVSEFALQSIFGKLIFMENGYANIGSNSPDMIKLNCADSRELVFEEALPP